MNVSMKHSAPPTQGTLMHLCRFMLGAPKASLEHEDHMISEVNLTSGRGSTEHGAPCRTCSVEARHSLDAVHSMQHPNKGYWWQRKQALVAGHPSKQAHMIRSLTM